MTDPTNEGAPMPAPHTSHELQLADTSPKGGGCGCGGCGCGSNTETGSSTGTTIESTATAATKGNEMTTTSYDVTGMTCGHCASAVTSISEFSTPRAMLSSRGSSPASRLRVKLSLASASRRTLCRNTWAISGR